MPYSVAVVAKYVFLSCALYWTLRAGEACCESCNRFRHVDIPFRYGLLDRAAPNDNHNHNDNAFDDIDAAKEELRKAEQRKAELIKRIKPYLTVIKALSHRENEKKNKYW